MYMHKPNTDYRESHAHFRGHYYRPSYTFGQGGWAEGYSIDYNWQPHSEMPWKPTQVAVDLVEAKIII